MTITDVCNLANDILGVEAIADYANDPSDEAKRFRRLYPVAACKVLTAHDWRNAVAWSTLASEAEDDYTSHASNNTSGSSTFECTTSIDADTPRTGTITVTYDTGLTDEYDYSSWTGAIFTLDGVTLNRTYDDGDTMVTTPNNHDNEFEYMYDLPSDCLRALEINHDDTIERLVEGDYLYTNEYDSELGVVLRYIKDIRDEVSSAVVYDEHVADAIAAELAFRLAPRKQRDLVLLMRDEAKEALDDAVAADAHQRVAEYPATGKKRWVDVK